MGNAYEITDYMLNYYIEMIENEREYRQIFTDPYRKDGREEEIKKESEEMDEKKDKDQTIKEESEEKE